MSGIEELWKEKLSNGSENWYARSINYWERQEATLNGVLGGFPAVSSVDLEGSCQFLQRLKTLPVSKGGSCFFGCAIDCGAGIGRVTQGCLLQFFDSVDLLEPVEHLLKTAKKTLENNPKVDRFIRKSLQVFTPEEDRYDVIWLQWCVLYLTDDDLVDLLKRCSKALRSQGLICIKENVVLKGNEYSIDSEDNSLIRTDRHYRNLFDKAGIQIVCEMRQPKLPPQIFPVQMYALR